MAKIEVKFPDGSVRAREGSGSVADFVRSIDESLARDVIAMKVNGCVMDLVRPIDADAVVELLTFDSPEGKEIIRHSASHIMAAAVKSLFPDAKLAIGPAIQDGFYYDFDVAQPFTEADLAAVESKMREIVELDEPFVRKELSRAEADDLFRKADEPYKLELLQDIDGEAATVYETGDFVDLCRGPHVSSAGRIKAFKLLSVAGAYWRGDERRPMLQRIYGTAFQTQDDLDKHLALLAEAEKRDHRKLGRELELFSFHEEIGAGLVLWHPKGAMIRNVIEDFWRQEHVRNGYELLFSPHIAKRSLWGLSGHLDFYAENMYAPMPIDNVDYQLKPMNCPFHMLIYKSRGRSYRELPLRWAELGTVYRYERSGVLHGLLRVRGFTQDDAHVICGPDQLDDEIREVISFCLFVLRTFGFSEYEVYLSTRPEKFVGTVESWDQATEALRNALATVDLNYEVDPGEGVFYGPKIDIKIKDSLGRAWQCSTIQVDFQEPERFDIEYVGTDGKPHRPIMIHRALMGSLERFFGCLIEHYAGAFPVWLAPVQLVVLPISDANVSYAESVCRKLRDEGLRAELNSRDEKIGHKIRAAQLQKIPYMLVVGRREQEKSTVSVRHRKEGDQGPVSLDAFIARITQDIESKAIW